MNHIAFEGQKVVFAELAEHEYVHVVIIDGDNFRVTENGAFEVKEQFVNPKVLNPVRYERPALWNFVYENKNPGVEVGVYAAESDVLPEMYENAEEEEAA